MSLPNVVVSSTTPPPATAAFVAIAASWHVRCGAGSAARPMFSCPSLARLFWDSFFGAPAPTDFVLVVADEAAAPGRAQSFGLSFSLRCGALGCVTREPAVRAVRLFGMLSEWLAPDVVSAGSVLDGDVALKKVRDDGTAYCSLDTCIAFCAEYYINAKWVLYYELTRGRPLVIDSIASWTRINSNSRQQQHCPIRTGDLGVISDPVRVLIPGCEDEGSYCRMAFNKMVPDEALLISSTNGSAEIKLTLIDVGITHKSKGIAEVASATVSTLPPGFSYGDALVTRRKSGLVVFILHDIRSFYVTDSDLVAVESTTGEVTHLTGECSELTQVVSIVGLQQLGTTTEGHSLRRWV
ncbi:hypothetical protein Pelo_19094 [Pelomyxa schiedti]|nr:hypothetical protein Pelo_19094 [Pelomyxa schiedti]